MSAPSASESMNVTAARSTTTPPWLRAASIASLRSSRALMSNSPSARTTVTGPWAALPCWIRYESATETLYQRGADSAREAGPDVLGGVRRVPADLDREGLRQLQTETAGAGRPLDVQLRLGPHVMIGDVEDQVVVLAHQPHDGGRQAVPQGVGGQL